MTDAAPRSHAHLIERLRATLSYTGIILTICAGLMLVPLACLVAWPSEARLAYGFVIPAAGLGLIGILLWRRFQPREAAALTIGQGSVIVVTSWTVVCVASAIPFMLVEGLSFTQAVFEAVSGWTTTGLSVVDVQRASHMALLWRSLSQLAGGAGIAVIMLASIAGPPGTGLSVAEGRSEQLVPHVRASLKLVLALYSSYAAAGLLAYWIAGMPLFEAINHSFTAVATGGFSTRPESIGAWNEMRIEAVTIVLMLLGSMNFLTAWGLVRRRFHHATRSGELRLAAVLIPLATVLIFAFVTAPIYGSSGKAVRVAVFEAVSALTGTGFSTTTYSAWPGFGMLVVVALMIVGGGVGSTSGGLKQHRVYVLLKSVWWDVRRALLPENVVMERFIWRGDRKDFVDDRRLRSLGDYVFLYLTVVLAVALIVAVAGHGLDVSLFESASIVGTVGLSMGATGPQASPLILWAGTVGMLLGRLEFYVVAVGVIRLAASVRTLIGARMSRRKQPRVP